MPRIKRPAVSATYFHVGNRSVRKMTLFARPGDYRAFLQVLTEGIELFGVRLVAYCIMPNHWHVVVGPTDSQTVSKLLHWVTTTHAVRWHRHRSSTGTGPVYQGRFWMSVPDSSTELIRICRYVERNGLRAQLAQRAQDWPWCSLAERLRGDTQRLPLAPVSFLHSPTWVDYVNAPRTVDELVARRKSANAAARPANRRGLSPPVENRYVPLKH